MNPPPTFSLDNYSLFPMGGGRKGFPLETQLPCATQRNKKTSATESKSLKGSIYFYWEKQKPAHYHFHKIYGLGKVTRCHHQWSHLREEDAVTEKELHTNAINHQYLRLSKSKASLP